MEKREYVHRGQRIELKDAEELFTEAVIQWDSNGSVVRRDCKTPDRHINFDCRVNNSMALVSVYTDDNSTVTFSAKQGGNIDLSDDICLVAVKLLEDRNKSGSDNYEDQSNAISLRDEMPNAISLIENERIVEHIEEVLKDIDNFNPAAHYLLKDLTKSLLLKHMTVNLRIDYDGRNLYENFTPFSGNFNSFFLSDPDLTSGYNFQLKDIYSKQIENPEKILIIEKIMSVYDFYCNYIKMFSPTGLGAGLLPDKKINRKFAMIMFELIDNLVALDQAS